ncbi:Alpha-galactosidase [Mucor velutinosus]|uniref:Alpha-galactosidase n=1 Tax=Mucor velutinosus TaxID=708070 RepID=A0AAN7DFU8_9FUNG|nr:Alpha-galactosidase [Mucor velutinosus]
MKYSAIFIIFSANFILYAQSQYHPSPCQVGQDTYVDQKVGEYLSICDSDGTSMLPSNATAKLSNAGVLTEEVKDSQRERMALLNVALKGSAYIGWHRVYADYSPHRH